MLRFGDDIELSASDLVGHLNCRYLTDLDLAVANGRLEKPKHWDPFLDLLRQRGSIHEKGFIDHLRSAGRQVVEVEGVGTGQALVDQTIAAMSAGAQIIFQGAFRTDGWVGRTDILERVETPSNLGDWSYEVIDTKLSRETKGGTVLQLSLYSDLVASVQGQIPERMHVVAPWSDYKPQSFRTSDYAAYYRKVKDGLKQAISRNSDQVNYPDPKEHCDVCRWRVPCDLRRRTDDHLCLVAGISKVQINELHSHDVNTVANLAQTPVPLTWKPERGALHSYERVREQARIQMEGREAKAILYEVLPRLAGFGLSCLPTPSAGDIFFDIEGDPFVGEHGLEYLFGYCFSNESGEMQYVGEWALSRAQEKAIFEHFIDFVIERLATFPDLHVYHYAPYEPAALKHLTGRYGTRADEVDRMLRSHLFVDLYSVVKNNIRASVESYSIKRLEPLYDYVRVTELSNANVALANLQAALELDDLDRITKDTRDVVEGYNRDDCLSTHGLRNWLERVRTNLIENGELIDRPPPVDGAPSEATSEWQIRIDDLIRRVTADIPADSALRSQEQQARWILAYVLDWHRREEKSAWWEYFRLCDLSAEELLEERPGVSGLEFVEAVGGTARAPIHRYRFAVQETELRGDEPLHCPGGAKFGTVDSISLDDRTIDIKKRMDSADLHPEAVFAHKIIGAKELANSLVRLGAYVAENGLVGNGPYQVGRNLLLREVPRIGGDAIRLEDEAALAAGLRIAPKLTGGILPIQGPPGTGKTFTGARMICELVRAGKRVGITANSHKVIRNLLEEIVRAADESGMDLRCIERVAEKEDALPRLTFTTDNGEVFSALGTSCHVAAGTPWLWAREEAFESIDVLFVDEAAQMSLANVLAVSQAAKSIVLLGDPQQLDQPVKGSHPEGVDVSALDYILGEEQTISPDKGLFLEETWRLHPDICAFTSELFYEGRLQSRKGLNIQEIKSTGLIGGTGLRFIPVQHQGNQNSAPEEADEIRKLVNDILSTRATWIDRDGKERALTLDDVLIITPYNAQVFELQQRLPGARVGTVDKFQGQEAPVAIYSMTTSTHADAPRGMEFLYSSNRLNVATSRAKCICIVVGSSALFEAECRTPRQMQLANAFCRYLEMAHNIQTDSDKSKHDLRNRL
jgi:predicted RecB family nuclease